MRAPRCVTERGGACAQRLVSSGGACAQRVITPCVANALCRARGGGQIHFLAKRAGALASLVVAQWLEQWASDPYT